jgi:phage tail-like protein
MPLLQKIVDDRSYTLKSDADAAAQAAAKSAEEAAKAEQAYREASREAAEASPALAAAARAKVEAAKAAFDSAAVKAAQDAIAAAKAVKNARASTPLAVGEPLSNLDEYPVAVYQFAVELSKSPGVYVALFQSVSGIEVSREVEGLTEGGKNEATHEFPGHISYGHITLETGLTSSSFFYDWMMAGQYHGIVRKFTFDLIQRRHNPAYASSSDPLFSEVKRWTFHNAFPVKWKISDLSIDDSERIVIESLELSFDFFELTFK